MQRRGGGGIKLDTAPCCPGGGDADVLVCKRAMNGPKVVSVRERES
jgi:hypothetical protein